MEKTTVASSPPGYIPLPVQHLGLPQQPPVPQQRILTAAEIGEQYRAEQFALCAIGQHQRETKYGVCGIITAVACFPIGLIALLVDKNTICSRCGKVFPS